jgi:uncharacterized protein YjbI with pentapeptide repeats
LIIFWVKETCYSGFFKSLENVIFATFGVCILLVIVFRDPFYILLTLFLVMLTLSAAFFSLIAGGFCYSIFKVAFKINQKVIVTIYTLCTMIASVLSANLIVSNNTAKAVYILVNMNVSIVKSLGGLVSGSIVVSAVVSITRFGENKNSKNFMFFRDWAIILGTFKGTSFYNLDLSNINFTDAKLANTDLRARKLYRTCFQGVTGLERARVDSRYLDLENPKVQKLLTQGASEDKDFSLLNLRGAYLQNAQMRRFNFTNTDFTGAYMQGFTGADMQGADLRGSILVRTQVIGVDFSGADLTGICIEDWSVNSQTIFTNVKCDYIYRKLDENGEPTDRFPANRNFEPREFESLYQEVENVVELIFKEGKNWQAALFGLRKLQIEEDDENLDLQLKGIEKRGDLWVFKVTYNQVLPKQEVEQRLNAAYQEMKYQLANKQQEINQLLGIMADQAKALSYSKQPFGNNFFIAGSTITNLTGSGQIEYSEAADQIRNMIASTAEPKQATTIAQNFLAQLQRQSVAATVETQIELIQQMILAEAQKDQVLKQFLIQQGQQITEALPESIIATAIKEAIAQLKK